MLSGLAGQGALALVWLAVVVALILAAARAVRAWPTLRRTGAPVGEVSLLGSLALDSRRRVHLVQAGRTRALVLVGGASDVLVSLPPGDG